MYFVGLGGGFRGFGVAAKRGSQEGCECTCSVVKAMWAIRLAAEVRAGEVAVS